MVRNGEYTLLEAPTRDLTPSDFSRKWLFQFHYVTSRLPSPTARSLYIMPFKTFSHILDLVLEFDYEAFSLGLTSEDFESEKERDNFAATGKYLNPFTPAQQLRDAVLETLEFCESTLGYFPDHTRTDPRSTSRIMREEEQLTELIERIEEAGEKGVWSARGSAGQQRSWWKRTRIWLRRAGVKRPCTWWRNRCGMWCL